MIISYTHEIPMGHRLREHKGQCRFLHGHNYLVEVSFSGTVDHTTGMVLDFSELKTAVRQVLGEYDHAFVLQEGDNVLREVDKTEMKLIFIAVPPTAENLALLWAGQISQALKRGGGRVSVRVHETRDCSAIA